MMPSRPPCMLPRSPAHQICKCHGCPFRIFFHRACSEIRLIGDPSIRHVYNIFFHDYNLTPKSSNETKCHLYGSHSQKHLLQCLRLPYEYHLYAFLLDIVPMFCLAQLMLCFLVQNKLINFNPPFPFPSKINIC